MKTFARLWVGVVFALCALIVSSALAVHHLALTVVLIGLTMFFLAFVLDF